MKCTSPPPPDDLDLAMLLDGEADMHVRIHVDGCSACHARLVALGEQKRAISVQLYRAGCPTPEELRDAQLGDLTRSDENFVMLHSANCPHCVRELAILRSFLADDAGTESVTGSIAERIGIWLGRLISGGAAPALDLRGDATALQLFEAGDAQIALESNPDPAQHGRYILGGLVSGIDPQSLIVHLWHNGVHQGTAPVDPLLGDFRISNLPAGTVELLIQGADRTIHLADVHVPYRRDD